MRRLRRLLARQLREAGADLLECERIVAEQRSRCSSTNAERRRGRLAVPLDRRRLAEPVTPLVPELDLDDLGVVLGAARDREALRELERDRPGACLHQANPRAPVVGRPLRSQAPGYT